MRDDDKGGAGAVLDRPQLELHGFAQVLVERRQRLIQQQQLRALGQGPRQRDARTLPARQRRRAPVAKPLHADQRQHLRHAVADDRPRRAIHPQAEGDVLRHAHMREQGVGLEHHVHRPLVGRNAGHVLAIQQDAPSIGLQQPRQHPQQRGLPRPGAAQQGEEFAAVDVEADIVHREVAAEPLGHAGDAEQGLRIRVAPGLGRAGPRGGEAHLPALNRAQTRERARSAACGTGPMVKKLARSASGGKTAGSLATAASTSARLAGTPFG